MPLKSKSAYSFTSTYQDPVDSRLTMRTERVPFGFRKFEDNIVHEVVEGDTLFGLAHRYFEGISERPAGLWWVIMDFQPTPIHDPTLRLEPGTRVIVPSRRRVLEKVFDEERVGEL